MRNILKQVLLYLFFGYSITCFSQFRPKEINWTTDGNTYLSVDKGNIVLTDVASNKASILIQREQLIPEGRAEPLSFDIFNLSADKNKLLIYTNTAKVWRYNTRGDYWLLDIPANKLIQLGKGLPSQSLMFAKISPDAQKAAYVSEHNIFVEDLVSQQIIRLTNDGTRKLINGTFDWVYEEEF